MSEAQRQAWHRTVQDVNDIIVGELAERGEWVVAHVETDSFWPINAQKVSYRGETIWIIPQTIKHYPAVAMKKVAGQNRLYCERLLMRFLSVLAWVEQKGFIVDGIGGALCQCQWGERRSMD